MVDEATGLPANLRELTVRFYYEYPVGDDDDDDAAGCLYTLLLSCILRRAPQFVPHEFKFLFSARTPRHIPQQQ
jgi:hypothetical protein